MPFSSTTLASTNTNVSEGQVCPHCRSAIFDIERRSFQPLLFGSLYQGERPWLKVKLGGRCWALTTLNGIKLQHVETSRLQAPLYIGSKLAHSPKITGTKHFEAMAPKLPVNRSKCNQLVNLLEHGPAGTF